MSTSKPIHCKCLNIAIKPTRTPSPNNLTTRPPKHLSDYKPCTIADRDLSIKIHSLALIRKHKESTGWSELVCLNCDTSILAFSASEQPTTDLLDSFKPPSTVFVSNALLSDNTDVDKLKTQASAAFGVLVKTPGGEVNTTSTDFETAEELNERYKKWSVKLRQETERLIEAYQEEQYRILNEALKRGEDEKRALAQKVKLAAVPSAQTTVASLNSAASTKHSTTVTDKMKSGGLARKVNFDEDSSAKVLTAEEEELFQFDESTNPTTPYMPTDAADNAAASESEDEAVEFEAPNRRTPCVLNISTREHSLARSAKRTMDR
ncbi:hypothetical protein HDV05_006468 [Chytridiales sp. JEL 0842]|nr:hypothetical protein HDV05_006468 [Chytridiales sp. JEL 0842]